LDLRSHVNRARVISAAQIRAARALLGWEQARLRAAAGVSKNTLMRLEGGADAKASTLAAVQAALERAGVEFIAAGGGKGAGVRLAAPEA
jgi:transcriptional regulator with XRE-family HTH domain